MPALSLALSPHHIEHLCTNSPLQLNVLVVGGGGREHALAWRMAQSESAKQIYVAPGSPGTEVEPKVTNAAVNVSKHAEVGLLLFL